MFRFSIRDVLWLTVVVGLALALWIERTQHAASREVLRQKTAHCNLLETVMDRGGYRIGLDAKGFFLGKPSEP